MNITVYDYTGARFGTSAGQQEYYLDKPPKIYKVDASTVGDFRAHWIDGDTLYTAHGDNGYWWLNSTCNARWLPKMIVALKEVEKLD